MMTDHNIRQATEADLPFLVEAIIAAEKSGTELLSYCTLYGLSLDEVHSLLTEMLEEDILGQELAYSQFSILEVNGSPAACISTWIEGEHGDSGQLKSSLLGYYIPMEHLNKASAHKALLQALRMDRFKGALQIECVYVSPEHRGKGLLKPLLDQVIRSTQVPSGTAQLMVDGSNEAALRAYEKLDFKVDRRIMADETLNQGILPSAIRCSMILDI